MNDSNASTVSITLRTVPALAGWQWIARGWQLLKANPIHIHMAAFFFLGALALAASLPVVGSVAAAVLMPALYLGVMTTIAQAEKTSSSQPSSLMSALTSAFRKDAQGDHSAFKRLAMLGLVYAIAVMAVVGLYSVFDDGQAFKALSQGAQLPQDAQARADMVSGMMSSFAGIIVFYAPVSMAFWFTQQLVGWHGQTISKAVFFSWLGCWRNKGAFAVYAVAWVLIFIAGSMGLVAIASLLGSPSIAGVLLTPLSLFLMVWVMCSFYASYESLVQIVE